MAKIDVAKSTLQVRCAAMIGLLSFLALTAIVTTWHTPYYEDESYYLRTVGIYHRHGMSRAFLNELPGPAGPWYTWVHAAAEPLTNLQVPGSRLVNVGLILLVTLATAMTLRGLGNEQPIYVAATLLAAPVIIVVSGLALTEVPAMASFYVSLAMVIAARNSESLGRSLAFAAISGLFLAFAILGRQQFLLVLGVIPLLMIGARHSFAVSVAVLFAFAIPLPALVFYVWGDLVPPETTFVGSGVAVSHGLLAFAYGGILYCLYDVDWLKHHWRPVITCAAIGLAANLMGNMLNFIPMKSVTMRLFSPDNLAFLGRVCGGMLVGTGVGFASYLAIQAWKERKNGATLFLMAAIAAILFSAFKITHQFSSRYVSLAVPMMVILGSRQAPLRWINLGLLLLGSLLGLASLTSYYINQLPG